MYMVRSHTGNSSCRVMMSGCGFRSTEHLVEWHWVFKRNWKLLIYAERRYCELGRHLDIKRYYGQFTGGTL